MKRPAPPLEYFTFTYPWRSSDYCVQAVCPPKALFGVSDMVGHPHGLRWRNYMRVLNRYIGRLLSHHPATDLAGLQELLTEHLLWHDRQIFAFRQLHDQAAFGFCVLFAFFDGTAGRIQWLGDCRAYRITRGPIAADGRRAFRVRCLTRDHNELAEAVAREGELVLFRDELMERSKRLGAFLGMGDSQHNRNVLVRSVSIDPLTPDDCVILMTDGIYIPHLRASLDGINFRVNRDRLYLESWFAHMLTEADLRLPPDEPNYWPELATILVEETIKLVRRRRHYRDDMALTGIYLA